MSEQEAVEKADRVRKAAETSLAIRNNELEMGAPAYLAYSKDRIELVKKTLVPRDATEADVYYLLELSARYGLDPFAKEIWIAKMGSRQGEGARCAILIGRDGLLALAEKNPYYRGIRGDVVRENDDFRKLPDPVTRTNGLQSYVSHGYGLPVKRGAVVGAWAEVYLDGREPTYFFAPLEDYRPSGNKLEYSPWKNMESVMILKVAEVNALRKAIRIGGLYLEPEMTRALELGLESEAKTPGDQAAELDYGTDPALAERLRAYFDALEYLPAKRRLLLAQGSLEGALAELAREAEERGIEVPEVPETIEGEAVEVEEDGQVVIA